ncbi:MAG: bifunctional O-acetylhomoserine aminocarboxypropyltransferase/cysteine synthase [Planctomycetes bacterium]|nr:bifunctional O-acetylhomoserine aminocarboxypropyltransferase/cysteine synthase [Planctomycetota bacterium]
MTSTTSPRLATRCLHAGQRPDPATGALAVPIHATVAYQFASSEHAAKLFALKEFGNIYSRLTNPTNDVLEQRLAALDGGAAALAFASGQAAITAAIVNITRSGQNFLAATSLYGGTWTLFTQTLKRLGIEVRLFDPDRPETIRELADENTRCVYLESQGNPKNDVPDFQVIADRAHAVGVPVICDNTVMTPALFRPIEHGADIVVYSCTKYIGGHGVHIGGALVDSGKFPWRDDPGRWGEFCSPDPSYHDLVLAEALAPVGNIAYIVRARTHVLRDTGACLSPFGAFLLLLGLETLPLRVKQHCANALAVAAWLEKHPAVAWVNYPGLASSGYHQRAKRYFPDGAGAIIGFGIKGGRAAGAAFIDAVKLASHVANIGDARTLVIHPATTTHQQLSPQEQKATGVTDDYIRLCIGIEDVADIQADLDQALRASQAKGEGGS